LKKFVFLTAVILLFPAWNAAASPAWDYDVLNRQRDAADLPPPENDDYTGRVLGEEPEDLTEAPAGPLPEPAPAEPEPVKPSVAGEPEPAAGPPVAAEPEPAAKPGLAAESAPPAAEEAPAVPALGLAAEIKPKHYLIFSEGLTASWLTRIVKQTGRSNFVFSDFLPGLFFNMKMANFKLVTPMIRLSAYYPLQSTFNKIPQPPKLPLHYGADLFVAPDFELGGLKYIRFNLAPGLHFFFLNSERWNYFNLGIVGLVGVELPLSRGWTILINGMASLDNGNLGANRDMEPFDIVYQYQVDIGVRYSKKVPNNYPYIKPRPKLSLNRPSLLAQPDV
jgi:hypothetical protein